MSPPSYWDIIEHLHTQYAREFPRTSGAVDAIRGLRALLEPNWKLDSRHGHPLDRLFRVAPHHVELAHLLAKLEALRRIPGHERVLVRIGSAADFTTAWYEVDFALKLTSDGHACRFLEEDESPRPDLLVEINAESWEVEVTSLNPPREDQLASTLGSFTSFIPFQHKCISGGVAYISNQLSNRSLSEVERQLRAGAAKARTDSTVVWVNVPGVIRAQVAPRELADRMDPQYRGLFVFDHQTPLPVARRFSSAVQRKAGRQFSGDTPSLLVVYDQLLSDDEELTLAGEDFGALIATYSRLTAVALIRPLRWRETVETFLNRADDRTHGRHALPDSEGESYIVWPSAMDPRAFDSIVDLVVRFPANLDHLYRDAKSDAGPQGTPI